MKRIKLAVLVCTVLACASLMLAGCQSQTYTPPSKEQSVPSTALGTPGTLRVGVNASSAPLAGQTSSSAHIVGIDVDVAAYLADQMGLKLEIVDVSNDPATALSQGKVDMALGVAASDEASGYWKSLPYIQTGVALFGTAAESAVPTVDSNPKIAAQASSKSSWRVTNLFGDASLVVQEDLKSAFDAMNSGAARYVASDAVIGTYVAFSNGYDDKIIALLQDPSGYCAAVGESNADLQTAVSAGIDKLVNGGVMNIIESKWLGKSLNLNDVTVVKSSGDKKDAKKEEKKDEKKEKKEESEEKKSDESSEGQAAEGEAAQGDAGEGEAAEGAEA